MKTIYVLVIRGFITFTVLAAPFRCHADIVSDSRLTAGVIDNYLQGLNNVNVFGNDILKYPANIAIDLATEAALTQMALSDKTDAEIRAIAEVPEYAGIISDILSLQSDMQAAAQGQPTKAGSLLKFSQDMWDLFWIIASKSGLQSSGILQSGETLTVFGAANLIIAYEFFVVGQVLNLELSVVDYGWGILNAGAEADQYAMDILGGLTFFSDTERAMLNDYFSHVDQGGIYDPLFRLLTSGLDITTYVPKTNYNVFDVTANYGLILPDVKNWTIGADAKVVTNNNQKRLQIAMWTYTRDTEVVFDNSAAGRAMPRVSLRFLTNGVWTTNPLGGTTNIWGLTDDTAHKNVLYGPKCAYTAEIALAPNSRLPSEVRTVWSFPGAPDTTNLTVFQFADIQVQSPNRSTNFLTGSTDSNRHVSMPVTLSSVLAVTDLHWNLSWLNTTNNPTNSVSPAAAQAQFTGFPTSLTSGQSVTGSLELTFPTNYPPGVYSGTLRIDALNASPVTLAVSVNVLSGVSSGFGSNWVQITAAAPWSARWEHACLEFGGKLWVMGGIVNYPSGCNDVWASNDGTNWSRVITTAPWPARFGFNCVTLDNKMWLLGGILRNDDTSFLNDVWSSSDGTNWTEVASHAGWSNRSDYGCVVFSNKLWVLGGGHYGGGYDNEVWNTSDGSNWTQVATSAPMWCPRGGHQSVVWADRIWVFGGTIGNTALNDVWSSLDGMHWRQETPAAEWAPRVHHKSAVFNGRIWMAGGAGEPGGPPYNDVWATALPFDSSSGLVAYYPFDGNANDASGNGLHGTNYGGVNYVPGRVGYAAQLDGLTGYILAPPDSAFTGTNDFTVSFWFKTTAPEGVFIDERSSAQPVGGDRGFATGFWDHTGGVSFGLENPDTSSGSYPHAGAYNDNQWHHAVEIRRGGNLVLFFVDGLLINDSTGSLVDIGVPNPLTIGKRFRYDDGRADNWYSGCLDELRICNRALSAQEVQQLYVAGGGLNAGLVAYYPLEGNANDASPTQNHGTLNGGVTFVPGRLGSAAHFDGVDGWILVPANSALTFQTNDFSVSLWFRTTDTEAYMVEERIQNPTKGWLCQIWGAPLLGPSFYLENGYTPEILAACAQTAQYQDGNWHAMTGVRAGSSIYLYIDGQMVSQVGGRLVDIGESQQMELGKTDVVTNPAQWYSGDLDELRIYNRALSAAEVAQLYTLVLPTLGATCQGGNLVFAWPTNMPAFTLVSATNLGPSAVWTPVSPGPVIVNGQCVVTNSMSGPSKFFRLRMP